MRDFRMEGETLLISETKRQEGEYPHIPYHLCRATLNNTLNILEFQK